MYIVVKEKLARKKEFVTGNILIDFA